MMRMRWTLLAAAAAWVVLPPLARAVDPEPPADEDFLEFLGSADSDDPQFNEYMASGAVDEALDKGKEGSETKPATDEPPANKVKTDGA